MDSAFLKVSVISKKLQHTLRQKFKNIWG